MISAVITFLTIAISIGLATWYIARFLEEDKF